MKYDRKTYRRSFQQEREYSRRLEEARLKKLKADQDKANARLTPAQRALVPEVDFGFVD